MVYFHLYLAYLNSGIILLDYYILLLSTRVLAKKTFPNTIENVLGRVGVGVNLPFCAAQTGEIHKQFPIFIL